MRDIKVRAWDKVNKRMLYFSDLSWHDEYDLLYFSKGSLDVPVGDNLEFLQFTGQQDKNGKESYHKDIIKRNDTLYIMEWHDNLVSWYLKPLHGGWHGTSQTDMFLMCEVIGNIYENPELVKGLEK